MCTAPRADDLAIRIREHLASSQIDPALLSACWHGYLASLLEWGLMTPDDHETLIRLLPPLEPNPVQEIFLEY